MHWKHSGESPRTEGRTEYLNFSAMGEIFSKAEIHSFRSRQQKISERGVNTATV